MLVITDLFFPQENGHFKWHKSWYILLCYPLCETWFIISQKLHLSLKSSVSLLWFKTGALTLHPSGLLLSGSLYVWKKKRKDYTHSQEDCSYSSLLLIVFLLFAVHFHQKPTPLQLATISQHSMTWWDTMRADEIHTLGLSVLDNNVSTHSPWEWRDTPSFCYSIFNASQPF